MNIINIRRNLIEINIILIFIISGIAAWGSSELKLYWYYIFKF